MTISYIGKYETLKAAEKEIIKEYCEGWENAIVNVGEKNVTVKRTRSTEDGDFVITTSSYDRPETETCVSICIDLRNNMIMEVY